jgi:hypothetical protein
MSRAVAICALGKPIALLGWRELK